MSWKQVIVIVGIWLSVSVASEPRSHLDLNSNFQQELNGQCPYGYVLKEGDIPGSGLSLETVEATIADCSHRCNNKPNCCSFEYSQTEKKCNLNTGCTPTTGIILDQGSLPWLFCTKGDSCVFLFYGDYYLGSPKCLSFFLCLILIYYFICIGEGIGTQMS